MSDEHTPGPSSPQGYPSAPPPGYPSAPPSGYPTAPPAGWQQAQYVPVDPGKTLGIVGFVLAFVFTPAGLIVSIIARSTSKRAGFSNGLATAGIWLSAIILAINLISIPLLLSAGWRVSWLSF